MTPRIQLHVDFESFRRHLDLVGGPSVVGGAQLTGQGRGVDAERQCAFSQFQPDLGFARPEIVLQVGYTRITGKPGIQLFGCRLELCQVTPLEADFDRDAPRPYLRLGEAKGENVRDGARFPPPKIEDIGKTGIAMFRVQQIDADRRHVGSRFIGIHVAVVLSENVADERLAFRLIR